MSTGVIEVGGRALTEQPGLLLPVDGAQPSRPWDALGSRLGSQGFDATLPSAERPPGAYAPAAAVFEPGQSTETAAARWRAADSIAGLRLARQAAREEAAPILEERITLLVTGNEAAVPRDVDPLSTATRVLDAERRFGKDSPQYRTAREGLVVDSRRYLGEWYSRLPQSRAAVRRRDRRLHIHGLFAHRHGARRPDPVGGGRRNRPPRQ